MKKIVLLFLGSVLMLSSCGGNKKEPVEVPKETIVKNAYSIELQAVYEKGDEISVVYKKGGFWDYEHPVNFKVTGQPVIQKLSIAIPEVGTIENMQISISTNKEQKTIAIKGISIFKNAKEVINGDNLGYVRYFNSNPGLAWDGKNLRYTLNFDGQYPPGFTGNEEFESMLVE